MIFKLNNEVVKVEVAPKVSETQDESLDTAQCVLEANTQRNPYAPGTSFEIIINEDTENEEKILFYLVGDSVTIFSADPIRYKHTLTLTQNTHKFAKYLVRNSVFSQPAQKTKKGFWALSQSLGPIFPYRESQQSPTLSLGMIVPISDNQGYEATPMTFGSRERIKGTPYIVISNFGATWSHVSGNINYDTMRECSLRHDMSVSDMNSLNTALYDVTGSTSWHGSAIQFASKLYAYYKIRGSNTEHELEINVPDDIEGLSSVYDVVPNKPYYIPKLRTLFNENDITEIYVSTKKASWDLAANSGHYTYQSYDCPYSINGYNKGFCVLPSNNTMFLAFLSTQINLYCDVYTYTCYDILKLLADRQKRKWTRNNPLPLFDIDENSETATILKNTIAPNFTFTQCTMYECIAEVFRLFDAIFTCDESNFLHIEYLNNINKTPIQFDYSGETRSINDDRHNTGLITYYQDARIEESFPNKKTFVRATSESYGVPSQTDHILNVPHKIDNIKSLYIKIRRFTFPYIWGNNSYQMGMATGNIRDGFALDITPYCVEESVWLTLNQSTSLPYNGDYRQVIQYNSITYAKGSNAIKLGGIFQQNWEGSQAMISYMAEKCALLRAMGITKVVHKDNSSDSVWGSIDNLMPASQDWANYLFRIVYETSVDGRLKMESFSNKYPGESLVDQYNGSIDVQKMGLNMLGLSMKLGEPTLTMTHKITSWADRVKKGSIYMNNGERWVANVCTYVFLESNEIQGTIEFVKNYNSLSQFVKLHRERRLTNISDYLTCKSEDNYIEYIYYSSRTIERRVQNGALRDSTLRNLIANGMSVQTTNAKFDTAVITTNEYSVVVPMVQYATGNMICWEMSFNHSISAGKRTLTGSGWFGTNTQFTKDVKYTDDEGYLDTTNIYIYSSDNVETEGDASVETNYPKCSTSGTAPIGLTNYEVYKQPNEIFAFNFQLCFLPERADTDFLNETFLEKCVNPDNERLFAYYSTTEKFDILEKKMILDNYTRVNITAKTAFEQENVAGFMATLDSTIPNGVVSWAIGDIEGNIYFASNDAEEAAGFNRLYVYFRYEPKRRTN